MTTDAFSFENLSETDIIQRCCDPNRQIVGGVKFGNYVIKVSDEVVVKFGAGVSAGEAENQRKAFEMLNSSIVRVPRLYHYFNWNNKGFLVMEYIHGEVFESVPSQQIRKIADILGHFSTLQRTRPGPIQPGVSQGLLWEENGEPVFESVKHMEKWLNHRLPDTEDKLALEQYPLVLCHLDLAPRNNIWLKDGSLCLVDWASAGFYPRFFEVCILKIMERSHNDYETDLIQNMERLTEEEEAQMLLLGHSFSNSIKYRFVSFNLQSCNR
jgi:thiamine kinase-like enzyme